MFSFVVLFIYVHAHNYLKEPVVLSPENCKMAQVIKETENHLGIPKAPFSVNIKNINVNITNNFILGNY